MNDDKFIKFVEDSKKTHGWKRIQWKTVFGLFRMRLFLDTVALNNVKSQRITQTRLKLCENKPLDEWCEWDKLGPFQYRHSQPPGPSTPRLLNIY